jgi:hypothetical protein
MEAMQEFFRQGGQPELSTPERSSAALYVQPGPDGPDREATPFRYLRSFGTAGIRGTSLG